MGKGVREGEEERREGEGRGKSAEEDPEEAEYKR